MRTVARGSHNPRQLVFGLWAAWFGPMSARARFVVDKVTQSHFLLAPQEGLQLGVICKYIVSTVYFSVYSAVLPSLAIFYSRRQQIIKIWVQSSQ